MNFLQAVLSCFKSYATFSGRAPRSEYWYWTLFTVLALATLHIADVVVFHIDVHNPHAIYPLRTAFALFTFLPALAVTARRLHDTNRSGWWFLLVFTIIGNIPLLIWCCPKGTEGENRFGADPLTT